MLRWYWDWVAPLWKAAIMAIRPCMDKLNFGSKKRFDAQKLLHLSPTNIRWGDPDHQRAAAAVLVEAVYVLPHSEKEAKKYWDFLGFERLVEFDMKEADMIMGAVFRNIKRRPTPAGAPEYVIAFRGTHNLYDVLNDIYIIEGLFKFSPRMEEVQDKFAKFFDQVVVPEANKTSSSSKLWLTGHSLGSTIAMLLVVGKLHSDRNFLRGINMRALLFNPPCPAVAEVDDDNNNDILNQLRETMNSFMDLMLCLMGLQLMDEKDRLLMSDWKPELYVNEKDIICNSYIGYFEKGSYKTANLPGGKSTTILLPSAELVKYVRKGNRRPENMISTRTLKEKWNELVFAHELNQWWEPNLALQTKTYQLKPPSLLAPS